MIPALLDLIPLPRELSQRERRQEHVIENLRQRRGLQFLLNQLRRLLLVAGEQAVIDPPLGVEHGIVAQQGVEERELRDVLADDQQADGHRRRQ